MWNGDKRCAVALSFDFDAESIWLVHGLTTPAFMARGAYGANVGIPRILGLLEKHDIPATFFVPAETVRRHERVVKEIHAKGHEIGHHGDIHETPTGLDVEEERRILETGMREIGAIVGEPPRGYRSPAWDLSPNSIRLFGEFGLLYDSSLMGDDFRPYLLEDDGKETEIIELPVSWELDDAPHFLFNFMPYIAGMSAPSKVYEIWAAEFEGAYECGGVFTLTLHPQTIGRHHRIQMLDRIIEHIASHDGVWFATCSEVATDWMKRKK